MKEGNMRIKPVIPIFFIAVCLVLSSCGGATVSPRSATPVALENFAETPTDIPATSTLELTSTTQPTFTPDPTPTPTETLVPVDISCLATTFVADVTVPDNTQVEFGETFTKTWRIRNIGTCAWPTDTELVFVEGDNLSARSRVLVGTVEVNEEIDISMNMTAPDEEGLWQNQWALRVRGNDIPGGGLSTRFYTGELPEPMLQGQVLWWTTPLTNVHVEIRQHPNSAVLAQAVTDEEGRFVIEDPPIGHVAIWTYVPNEEYSDQFFWHQIQPGVTEVVLQVTKTVFAGLSVGGTPSTTPTLSWPSFPDATEYCVYLMREGNQVIHECVAGTTWSVTEDLESGKEYCGFIQAKVEDIPIATYAQDCFTPQP
jgi:hypothetical protein